MEDDTTRPGPDRPEPSPWWPDQEPPAEAGKEPPARGQPADPGGWPAAWGPPPAPPPAGGDPPGPGEPPARPPPWGPPGQAPSWEQAPQRPQPAWGMPPPPAPPARRTPIVALLVGAGVLLVLVVAAAVLLVVRSANRDRLERPLAAPASVAGLRRLDDPTLASVVDQATAQFRQNGTDAVGAVYGPSLAEPRLFLVAVRDSIDLVSGRRLLLDRFARSASPGTRFDPGSIRELRRGGRRYDCTPVGGGQVSAACVWSGDKAFLITAAYGQAGVDQLADWSDQALDQLTA